ncbi:MAG: FAD-dependent oxidoreductase [Fibrobacter sp.]|nr:FAD-dependent oxidoreductase [Fibrobacter sp.]
MEKPQNFYDVVIVGGGPAGLTAALYLARAQYRVVVLEKEKFGGQITITSEVVNYPGVDKTSGTALTDTMRKQAQSFGAEFMLAEVTSLSVNGDVKQVETSRGTLNCFGILLATGAHPRMVGFEGEAEFRGHGVAYCATCDGEFFTGKDVFVVGGGFAAAEESVFLTKYAKHVTVLVRKEDFSCAKATADAAKKHPDITIVPNTEVVRVEGDSALKKLVYRNNKTGEETVYTPANGDTFGVFVFAGYEPATDLVKGVVDLDEHGYILTDRSQKTSVEGIYAAGDVCVKSLRQVVTAVGDGALAATELEHYAKVLQEKTGLIPDFTKPAESTSGKSLSETASQPSSNAGGLFTGDILAQLNTVFGRMQNALTLKLYLDDRPVSQELKTYMEEMAKLTDKLTVEVANDSESAEDKPFVRVCKKDGSATGLAFHGVPGGHEFTSFVLGLYNAAGPGQALDADVKARIQAIQKPVDMRIMVSLTCTMCPELVMAAQKIAAENPNVTAEVYDLNHFPAWKDKYNVMSVPCFVINGGSPNFGKKNIQQLLDMISAE